MKSWPESLSNLPGADLIESGLKDLSLGIESIPALLTLIGATRLRQLAIAVPVQPPTASLAEHRLYEMLADEHGNNAHSRYNALIGKLVSFTRTASCVL